MYHIIDDRASGKTSRLMLIAKENNATFVCSNVHAMEAKAHAYGIVGINFMSYYDFATQTRGADIGPYVVDEILTLHNYLLNANGGRGELIGYTLSQE